MAGHQAEIKEAPLGRVQSLVRAFGLLDELAKNDSMTLSELASLVSLPRSTTHRLLTTMQALRYVAFDRETAQWSIGIQAFTVGSVFAQSKGLGNLGHSIMRSLSPEVQHFVDFAVTEREGICSVGQFAENRRQQTAAKPDAVLPMHTTASGKAIMAQWSRSELDRYLRGDLLKGRTARSIVDGDRLRRELADTYERGFAFDDEEHEIGLRCVAAVVHDRHGAPCGALSLSDRTSRLPRARLDELGPTLVLAARKMSTEVANRHS